MRLIGEKRHGAPSLADRPDFQFTALTYKGDRLLVWSDPEKLRQTLQPALRDPSTPRWAVELGAEVLRLGLPQPLPVR